MQAIVAHAQSLAERLAAFLVHIHKTSSADWFQAVAELDLSLTQVKALHVAGGEGELTVKGLAEALSLSLPATSRAVEGLVKRGLLDRRECMDDRRSRRVELTGDGRAAIERLQAARVAGLHEFVSSLSPAQRAQLDKALGEVLP